MRLATDAACVIPGSVHLQLNLCAWYRRMETCTRFSPSPLTGFRAPPYSFFRIRPVGRLAAPVISPQANP